jgi:AcrR family transcriptional regulator
MGLREEKKERQKRDIYRTAVNLFHEKGYEETRVEDITRRLRISRATFFNYYPSKDSILHQSAEEAMCFYRAVFLEIMRGQMGLVGGRVSMEKATIGELTASILAQGQERGEVRSDYPAQQLAEILVGIYNNVILSWLHSDTAYSLVQRLKEAADCLFCGSAGAMPARWQATGSLHKKQPERAVP